MIEQLYSGPIEGIEPEDIKKARKDQENVNFIVSAGISHRSHPKCENHDP